MPKMSLEEISKKLQQVGSSLGMLEGVILKFHLQTHASPDDAVLCIRVRPHPEDIVDSGHRYWFYPTERQPPSCEFTDRTAGYPAGGYKSFSSDTEAFAHLLKAIHYEVEAGIKYLSETRAVLLALK